MLLIKQKKYIYFIWPLALLFIGCSVESSSSHNTSPPVDPNSPSTIAPTYQQNGDYLEVSIDYQRSPNATGPRVMELRVGYSEALQYVSFSQGTAVVTAQKELIVQDKPNRVLRTVMFSSSNANSLDSGRVVTYRFKKIKTGDASVEILTDKPIFAPADANLGLVVSDPVAIHVD